MINWKCSLKMTPEPPYTNPIRPESKYDLSQVNAINKELSHISFHCQMNMILKVVL